MIPFMGVAPITLHLSEDKPVLAYCDVHGSFMAYSSQLNGPCPRCVQAAVHPKPTHRKRLLDGHEGILRRSGFYTEDEVLDVPQSWNTVQVPRTGAIVMEMVHNEAVDIAEREIRASIEQTLAWCDE